MNEKPANEPKPGFLARISLFGFVRWLFRWRTIRKFLFVGACLFTLLGLLIAEENWRGKRAWEKYKTEQEAKGEKFDLAAFIPPPVPDDENFTMTPFLQPLFEVDPATGRARDAKAANREDNFVHELFSTDRKFAAERHWTNRNRSDYDIWTSALQTNDSLTESHFSTPAEAATDLLKALEKYRPIFDELQTASQRPYCRFKTFDAAKENPGTLFLPPVAFLKNLTLLYQLRAKAELTLGQNAPALADTRMIFHLANTLKGQPTDLMGLVRISLLNIAAHTIQEGLAGRRWSDADLVELQKQLAETDLLAEYGAFLRSERAFTTSSMNFYVRVQTPAFPRGWLYQNELKLARLYDETLLPQVDAAGHRVYSAKIEESARAATNELKSGFWPNTVFVRLLRPTLDKIQLKFAAGQVYLDEAAIACALERSRLANGKFPETLAALPPQFIKSLPADVFSGDPLKYHPTDDGQFVLYSVGWNEKDDGCIVGMTKDRKPHRVTTEGDWVWPQDPLTDGHVGRA